jgi:MoaA/NifB/PqqE/SkfB family radical SAM enzyme
MPRIGIELNNVCNLDCGHCFRDIYRGTGDKSNLFFPLDLLAKILIEAKPLGYTHIAITGGEPPLHPQFGEALELIAQHGYTYHFLTNARNFSKTLKAVTPALRRAKLTSISISVDGATEATHDRIRGKDSYREVVSAMAACQAVGIPVGIISTINRANRHEIDQLALLGAHLGVKKHVFVHQNPTQHNFSNELVLPLSEWRSIERDVARLRGEFRHEIEMAVGFYTEYYLPRCAPLALDDLNIDYKGRLTLCCQISNYRDGAEDGEDVVADLQQQSLPTALSRVMKLINQVHSERLEMAADPARREQLHYPCLVCLDRFGKTKAESAFVPLQGLQRNE